MKCKTCLWHSKNEIDIKNDSELVRCYCDMDRIQFDNYLEEQHELGHTHAGNDCNMYSPIVSPEKENKNEN